MEVKRKKGQTVHNEARMLAMSVIKFFDEEAAKKLLKFPLTQATKRSAAATGLSERTIKYLRAEAKALQKSDEKCSTPDRQKPLLGHTEVHQFSCNTSAIDIDHIRHQQLDHHVYCNQSKRSGNDSSLLEDLTYVVEDMNLGIASISRSEINGNRNVWVIRGLQEYPVVMLLYEKKDTISLANKDICTAQIKMETDEDTCNFQTQCMNLSFLSNYSTTADEEPEFITSDLVDRSFVRKSDFDRPNQHNTIQCIELRSISAMSDIKSEEFSHDSGDVKLELKQEGNNTDRPTLVSNDIFKKVEGLLDRTMLGSFESKDFSNAILINDDTTVADNQIAILNNSKSKVQDLTTQKCNLSSMITENPKGYVLEEIASYEQGDLAHDQLNSNDDEIKDEKQESCKLYVKELQQLDVASKQICILKTNVNEKSQSDQIPEIASYSMLDRELATLPIISFFQEKMPMLNELVVNCETVENQEYHKCTYCEKRFVTFTSMKKHEHYHMVDRDPQFLYDKKKPTTAAGSKVNKQRKTGKKSYDCSQCQRKFTTLYQLKTHEQSHAGKIPYQSSPSGNERVIQTPLKTFQMTRTAIRRHQCSYCEKKFPSASKLEIHERFHTGERPYQCSHCDNKFFTAQGVQLHERQHTGERPYPCSYCEKRFMRPAQRNVHERYHTGDRPYQCSHCPKKFITQQELKVHMRVHTGERPYQCSHCDKKFITLYHLKTHVHCHTGYQFYCIQCDKKFFSSSSLKRHERSHAAERGPRTCENATCN